MLSSFRFDDVTFVRTAESAGKQNAMKSAACLVEATILEAKDRDRIGSATDPLLCCTRELADSASCTLGEVMSGLERLTLSLSGIKQKPTYPQKSWF